MWNCPADAKCTPEGTLGADQLKLSPGISALQAYPPKAAPRIHLVPLSFTEKAKTFEAVSRLNVYKYN